jgi:hypothetical protein
VTVALVDQRCGRWNYWRTGDVLNVRMGVQVTNTSAEPITIAPQEFRLWVWANMPVADATPPEGRPAPVAVPPGGAVPLELRFRRLGYARCNQVMQLSTGGGVEMAGHGLNLRPISFIADRTDT